MAVAVVIPVHDGDLTPALRQLRQVASENKPQLARHRAAIGPLRAAPAPHSQTSKPTILEDAMTTTTSYKFLTSIRE